MRETSHERSSSQKPLFSVVAGAGFAMAFASLVALASWGFDHASEVFAVPMNPPLEKVSPRQQLFRLSLKVPAEVRAPHSFSIIAPTAGVIDHLLIKSGDLVRRGQIIGWMSSSRRHELLQNLENQSSAQIRQWTAIHSPIAIRAHRSGMVNEVSVTERQSVAERQTLFRASERVFFEGSIKTNTHFSNPTSANVLHQRPPVRADLVWRGQRRPVKWIPRHGHHRDLSSLSHFAFEMLEPTAGLRPGQKVMIEIVLYEKQRAIVVPNWLIHGQSQSWVKVFTEDVYGEVAAQEIYLGKSDGQWTEVLSPLEMETTFLFQPSPHLERFAARESDPPQHLLLEN